MEALDFVCTLDLEDELIRALGTEVEKRLIEADGELKSLRTLQRQPAAEPVHAEPAPPLDERSVRQQAWLCAPAGRRRGSDPGSGPLDGVLAHF